MSKNSYLKSLFERASSSDASILIPESDDLRVQEAIIKLKSLNFNILDINNFNDDEKYFNFISNKKFTDNWPSDQIANYLTDPVNKALAILGCDEVDGVIAGASRSTADIIRSSLRTIGINQNYKWISSVFILGSPDKKTIFTCRFRL